MKNFLNDEVLCYFDFADIFQRKSHPFEPRFIYLYPNSLQNFDQFGLEKLNFGIGIYIFMLFIISPNSPKSLRDSDHINPKLIEFAGRLNDKI